MEDVKQENANQSWLQDLMNAVLILKECLLVTTNNPLTVTYKALPWHNNNKKPKQICWKFGDGKDTCIQYPENYTGQYLVRHTYREPGQYEVCVKILYYGGCEATNVKRSMSVNFAVQILNDYQVNTTADPLHVALQSIAMA